MGRLEVGTVSFCHPGTVGGLHFPACPGGDEERPAARRGARGGHKMAALGAWGRAARRGRLWGAARPLWGWRRPQPQRALGQDAGTAGGT